MQLKLTEELNTIRESLKHDYYKKGIEKDLEEDFWALSKFTPDFNVKLESFLSAYKKFNQDAYNSAVRKRDQLVAAMENDPDLSYNINTYKNKYYNESLADLVKNVTEKERIIEIDGRLVQQINPVFFDPIPSGILDYRAHFFAPRKNFFGMLINTYVADLLVIWGMTLLLYIALYYEWLRKLINSFDKVPGKFTLPKVSLSKKKESISK
jgi:hypothetical protein